MVLSHLTLIKLCMQPGILDIIYAIEPKYNPSIALLHIAFLSILRHSVLPQARNLNRPGDEPIIAASPARWLKHSKRGVDDRRDAYCIHGQIRRRRMRY